MLDLFGREVKRGDVIAYGTSGSGGKMKYAESKIGVVNNILPRATHIRGSRTWKKLLKESLVSAKVSDPNLPDSIDTYEKVTFYPIFNGDSGGLQFAVLRKNGKPKRNVIITMSFILLDKEALTGNWKTAYDEVCKAFKI